MDLSDSQEAVRNLASGRVSGKAAKIIEKTGVQEEIRVEIRWIPAHAGECSAYTAYHNETAHRGLGLSPRQQMYLAFPGEAYTRMLTMLFLPLTVSCVVGAIGSTSYRTGGKLLRCVLFYWLLSDASAAIVAVMTTALLSMVRNETASSLLHAAEMPLNFSAVTTTDLLMDMIRGLFPANIMDVSAKAWASGLPSPESGEGQNTMRQRCDPPHNERAHWLEEHNVALRWLNGLGLLSFSAALGFVLAHNADDRNVLLNFFINLSNGVTAMGKLLSWFTPLALLSLTATNVVTSANTLRSAGSLSLLVTFTLNVLVSVMVHTFVVLPLIQWMLVQRWHRALPRFLRKSYLPLVVSGGTGSLAASLPMSLSVLEMKLGVDARVVRTVAPMGVVLGRAGTVAHLTASLVFLSYVHRVTLSFMDLMGLGANALVVSMADAGSMPAIVNLLLGGKPGLEEPLVASTMPLVTWLTTMANTYDIFVASVVCYDIVQDDLSEDDECGTEEAQ
ncbi:putative sodium-dependent excitatory amino acid transporter glt-3 [Haemaphysalis longicornis]